MRSRPLPLTAWPFLLLIAAAAVAVVVHAGAQTGSGRLKIVPPTTLTDQWPVQVNGWWGLINEPGNLNFEPYLDYIGNVIEGQAPAASNGRFGMINGRGRWSIEPTFDHLDRFSEGYAVFRRDGRSGFINADGDEVLRPELVDARRFQDGFAAIRTARGCGYIDASFKVAVPPVFAVARSLHQGLGVVAIGVPVAGSPGAQTLERMSGVPLDELVDADVLAHPTTPAPAGPSSGPSSGPPTGLPTGLSTGPVPPEPTYETVPVNRLWGVINKSGRLVWLDRTGRVEAMTDFGEHLAPVRIDGRWGFISRAFRLVVKPRWDDVRPFKRGYAAVRQGDKWGYVDAAGRLVIEPVWDEAFDFEETLALVRRGDLWGYIDVAGRVAIEPQFTRAESFFRGRARVNAGWDRRPEAFGYIDVAGQIVFDPRFGDRGILDIRRGGPGEVVVNDVFSGADGTSNRRRSRVISAPPPRPVPLLNVIPEFLYPDGLSVDEEPLGRGDAGTVRGLPRNLPPRR